MNPKDPSSHPDSDAESGDAEVVAMIHPLPDDVGPSELFMQQMRLRIMKLQAAKAAASKQAA